MARRRSGINAPIREPEGALECPERTREGSALGPASQCAQGSGRMPLTFEYDQESGMLMGYGTGRLCFEDFHQGSLPDYPMGTPELVDLRDVTEMDLTREQIRAIAHVEGQEPGRISRMAILAGSDLGFGLSRMFQVLADEASYEIKVFRDIDGAKTWLRST